MGKTRTTNVNINYQVTTADIERGNALLNKASKATDDLRGKVDKTKDSSKKAGQEFKKAGDEGAKSFMNMGNVLKTVSFVLIGREVLEFTKKIIAIRGEFQKFEAVLTNTLGSKSAALIALGRINEFAKSTPFGVSELTANFIKLANRGVEPTVKQMRAIADLSATLGKSFDQVVEAILDVNNPERWKEIGVRAETSGDKVRLSFRGATVEVDRTVKGVTDAVVALGQLKGVAGSTEAISKTLAGQVNNLGDAWEQVFNTLGQGNQGVLFDTISLLAKAIEKANELLKGPAQKYTELTSKTLSDEIDNFNVLVTTFGSIDKASEEFSKKTETRLKEITDRQRELMNVPKFEGGTEGIKAREEELAHLRDLYDIYSLELPKAIEETIKKLREKGKEEQAVNSKKALEEQAKESQRIGEQANNYLEDLSDQELLALTETLKAKTDQRKREADAEKEIAKNSAAHVKYYEDLKVKKTKEAEDEKIKLEEDAAQKRIEIEAQAAEQRRKIQDSLVDFFGNSLSLLLTSQKDNSQKELDDLSKKYDRQIELAGDDKRAKMELEIKFDREKERIAKQEGERKKKQALIQIAIDTAMNAVKLFAETIPPGILSAIAVAFGLVQASVVSRQQFKDGVINLQGPGTTTSDSIPARLSRGESVMTADETQSSMGIFKAVRAQKLNDKVMKDIVSGRSGGSSAFSDGRIVDRLASIEKELQANRPIDLVERGGLLFKAKERDDKNKRFIWQNTIGKL